MVSTKNLIWRGRANSVLSSKPEKNGKKMDDAVNDMFKHFPPQGKGWFRGSAFWRAPKCPAQPADASRRLAHLATTWTTAQFLFSSRFVLDHSLRHVP